MSINVRPGERLITVGGLRIAHRGLPPFRARSANDHADDWPVWFVVGTDRVNWMRFPDHPGTVLTNRATAEAVATALNAMAGAA